MSAFAERVEELFDAYRNVAENYAKWQGDVSHERVGLMGKHDITAILHLGDKGESTMSKLAQKTSLSVSNATMVVDRLVRLGLAVRRRGDDDRRVVRVSLTDDGVKFLQIIHETAHRAIRVILGTLNEHEQEMLLTLARKIGATLAQGTQRTVFSMKPAHESDQKS